MFQVPHHLTSIDSNNHYVKVGIAEAYYEVDTSRHGKLFLEIKTKYPLKLSLSVDSWQISLHRIHFTNIFHGLFLKFIINSLSFWQGSQLHTSTSIMRLTLTLILLEMRLKYISQHYLVSCYSPVLQL